MVVLLALFGAGAQAIAERRDAAAHPPPGELVELPDGRALHLQVAGRQHVGPTVVLESGAGGSSAAWGWVHPELAEHTTVVSYDRAGLGWSDGTPHGRDTRAVVSDLRAALAAAGLAPPYVLVGHSLGGHYVRGFAAEHPAEVAGVVLVDPSHEDASAVLGESPADYAPMLRAVQLATRLGLTRLYNPSDFDIRSLPEPHRSQALAQLRRASTADAQAIELLAVDGAATELAGAGSLGAIPLRVLVAGGGGTDEDSARAVAAMADLRQGMTALSSQAEVRMVPTANHVSIVTHPEYAEAVTAEILDVVEVTR